MEKKEEKKGFWASLFVPKSCGCCCGTQIEEVKEDEPKREETKEKKKIQIKISQLVTAVATVNV